MRRRAGEGFCDLAGLGREADRRAAEAGGIGKLAVVRGARLRHDARAEETRQTDPKPFADTPWPATARDRNRNVNIRNICGAGAIDPHTGSRRNVPRGAGGTLPTPGEEGDGP